VLSQQPVIAVAGSQGAGKTTLVKSLYGLDDTWLAGNEGRGERSPLLIVESPDIDTPVATVVEQAFVEEYGLKRYVQREVMVTPEEFRLALQGERPGQLLPKLTVPSRYFEGNSWQSLVRQSLVGADMCVIVTDETRLANSEQSKILENFQGPLEGSCPIVVITKTEGKTTKQLEELTSSAAEIFGLNTKQAGQRIVCSTAQAESAAEWKSKLAEAMRELTQVQQTFRAKQLNELHDVLTDDLADLLSEVDMACREISLTTSQFGVSTPEEVACDGTICGN
jgi:ethanolamine utilization protein EutP (predicted NTPase)